ncbi:hypothetical protein [Pseudomonas chlororaphis]
MSSPEEQSATIYFEDLIHFLAERRPDQKCSVCGQSEGWKFHAESRDKSENPKMSVFEIPAQDKPGQKAWLEAVCIECPKCASMNLLGASTILQFIADRAKKNG